VGDDPGHATECAGDGGAEADAEAIAIAADVRGGKAGGVTMILCGDALTELRKLPDESVHCCITSPPYWGLRDYGVPGQLGLEKTPEEYVARMVEVFREVRRVLRKDGTLWLNLGDSYATGAGKASAPGGGAQGARFIEAGPSGYRGGHDLSPKHSQVPDGKNPNAMIPTYQPNRMPLPGLKPKDLIGIPWRVAFALQADGWYLRQDIIWHKPNPMPESVTDRPTKSHEYIFLMAKSPRYYYDNISIMEPAQYGEQHANKTTSWGTNRKHPNKANAADYAFKGDNHTTSKMSDGGYGRNRRSVWTVTTKPFSGAHSATFPPDLIEPMVKAGCPVGGTVLDPFFGAGTTGLVAMRLGRDFIGIELNPQYCEMAQRRIYGTLIQEARP
jgi:DNA modification methylase